MKTTIIKGTKHAPAIKILPILDSKITEQNGLVYLEGYIHKKYMEDRYGDIAVPFQKAGVYRLNIFKENPVLLIDHVNRIDHLAGSVVEIKETKKGLYFKSLFSTSTHPNIEHARHIYKEGHAKGISIAGRFHYEDCFNPQHLTLIEIYEISLIAIPANPN